MSSPQLVAIECFLARLDKTYKPTPPIRFGGGGFMVADGRWEALLCMVLCMEVKLPPTARRRRGQKCRSQSPRDEGLPMAFLILDNFHLPFHRTILLAQIVMGCSPAAVRVRKLAWWVHTGGAIGGPAK